MSCETNAGGGARGWACALAAHPCVDVSGSGASSVAAWSGAGSSLANASAGHRFDGSEVQERPHTCHSQDALCMLVATCAYGSHMQHQLCTAWNASKSAPHLVRPRAAIVLRRPLALVNRRAPLHVCVEGYYVVHNATKGINVGHQRVSRCAPLARARQLRRAVQVRTAICAHLIRAKGCKPEIGYYQMVAVKENVGRLEITVALSAML